MGDHSKLIAATMSEKELEDAVLEMAHALGYLCFHALPARSKDGQRWRTHQRGDVGFPDLVMVHERTGATIIAELKAEKGKVTAAQGQWLEALGRGPGAFLWRPSDWLDGTIGEVLARRRSEVLARRRNETQI